MMGSETSVEDSTQAKAASQGLIGCRKRSGFARRTATRAEAHFDFKPLARRKRRFSTMAHAFVTFSEAC